MRDIIDQIVNLTTLFIGMENFRSRGIKGELREFYIGQVCYSLKVTDNGAIAYKKVESLEWTEVESVIQITDAVIL